MKKKIALASALAIAFSINTAVFAAQPNPQVKADAASINSACTQDAEATGCGGMVVGKGLLKCMHKYKKANQSYKFSPGCRTAMKQFRSDRKASR